MKINSKTHPSPKSGEQNEVKDNYHKQVKALSSKDELWYHTLFDNMLEAFVYAKIEFQNDSPIDFTIVSVNGAFEKITGLKNVVGKKLSEIFDDFAELQSYFLSFSEKFETTVEPERFETFFAPLKKWFSVTIYASEGDHFMAIFEDITQVKQAELQIQKLDRINRVRTNINELIVRTRDIHVIFHEACSIALSEGKFVMAWIGIKNEITQVLDVVGHAGIADDYLQKININFNDRVQYSGPTGLTVINGMHHFTTDIETDPSMMPWREDALRIGYRSSAAFPLKIRGKAVGAMTLYAKEKNFFCNEELALLDELAVDISFAIEFIQNEKEHQRASEELRRSEEKFSRLFDLSPDAMILCTMPDGKYVSVNQSFVELTGYSAAEAIGKTSIELNFWVDLDQRTELINTLAGVDGYMSIEAPLRMKDGRIVEAQISEKIIDIGGKSYLLIISRDITQRKQEEKEISMLAQTIKGITECVSITDVNDIVLFVNKAFEDTYGYTASELLGSSIAIVRSPKTPAQIGREIHPATLAGGWKGEIWNIKKDGTEFPIFLSTSIVKDQNGKISALVGIAEDITKRKQAEQQLNLLTKAVQSTANAIVITDRNGVIDAVNPAFSRLTGYSADEVIGKKPSVLKSGVQSQEFYKKLWDTILSGEVWKGEIENKRKDGIHYLEEMTITPLRQSTGEISHFIAVKQDITEQKNLQGQLLQAQKIQSIGTLAGGIAHDFNNILGIIRAYAFLLGRGQTDKEKFNESITAIDNAVNRGAALVRQILTFARKTETSFTMLKIPDLIRELSSMLRETFPKTITINEAIFEDIPKVNADHTQMHQAILNLCVNARDAMPNGGEITIAADRVMKKNILQQFPAADADLYVRIAVSDTGTGMDQATKSRIFDPFFTTKEIGKGTGMGLAVVTGIIQNHHGFIQVESIIDAGTTFYLYIPVPPVLEQAAIVNAEESKIVSGGIETILLVEDEDLLRNLVESLLIAKGYKVLIAKDGPEAVKIYKEQYKEIALVLTDMGLPKLSGIDEFKLLKKINPTVKVVLASGFLDPDIKSDLFLAGAKGFIQKPYNIDEVFQKIREAIDT